MTSSKPSASPSVDPSGTASVDPSSMPYESLSKALSEKSRSSPTSYPTEPCVDRFKIGRASWGVGILLGSALGEMLGSTLGSADETELGSSDDAFDCDSDWHA